MAAELAEVRRNNERLQKQLETLRAVQGKGGDEEMDLDEDGDDAEKAREERIKVLNENIRAIAAVYTENSNEYKAIKAERDDLLKLRRETKPLNVQIQRVDKRIEKEKKRVGRAEEQLEADRKRLKDVEGDIKGDLQELEEARTSLTQLEDERKQLLLREAQNQQGQQHNAVAGGEGEVGDEETKAWLRTVEAIQKRAQAPGVQSELAAQVGSVVEMLRILCRQLPAVVEDSPGQQAQPTTGQPTQPQNPPPPAAPAAAKPTPQQQQGAKPAPGQPVANGAAQGHGGAPPAKATGSGSNGVNDGLPKVLAPNGQLPPRAAGAMEQTATAATDPTATAATATSDHKGEGDDDEGEDGDDDGMQEDGSTTGMDVQDVLGMLPQGQRSAIIAKLRGQRSSSPGQEEGRERNGRERSPRPCRRDDKNL